MYTHGDTLLTEGPLNRMCFCLSHTHTHTYTHTHPPKTKQVLEEDVAAVFRKTGLSLHAEMDNLEGSVSASVWG